MKQSLALALLLASCTALSAAAQTPAAPAATQTPAAPAAAAAQTPAAPAAGSFKTGVIAFQDAVAKTNEGKRAIADLQKKYDPKRQQLKTLSDEIDTLSKQLQAQRATLTEAQRTSRSKVIDEKKKQLDQDAEAAQNDFSQEMQGIYGPLSSKVYEVLQSYAKQQGFKLVLDISQEQSPVLVADDDINITQQVVDAYNAKSGVPAPTPQGAPDAPQPPPQPKPAPASPTH